jgi:hypothetical protein
VVGAVGKNKSVSLPQKQQHFFSFAQIAIVFVMVFAYI